MTLLFIALLLQAPQVNLQQNAKAEYVLVIKEGAATTVKPLPRDFCPLNIEASKNLVWIHGEIRGQQKTLVFKVHQDILILVDEPIDQPTDPNG